LAITPVRDRGIAAMNPVRISNRGRFCVYEQGLLSLAYGVSRRGFPDLDQLTCNQSHLSLDALLHKLVIVYTGDIEFQRKEI
jgi:hypothetical protein